MLLAGLLTAPAHAQLRPDVIAYWQRLHECEQPSSWHVHGPAKSKPGHPSYPGGLGVLAENWTWAAGELGLVRRYPTADKAPPLVQIRVADYAYRAHRWYWGCFRVVGYPPR